MNKSIVLTIWDNRIFHIIFKQPLAHIHEHYFHPSLDKIHSLLTTAKVTPALGTLLPHGIALVMVWVLLSWSFYLILLYLVVVSEVCFFLKENEEGVYLGEK